MRLWRVAGQDGKGFYFTEVNGTVMSSAVSEMIGRDISSMTDQHPRPDDDGIQNVTTSDHFCVCFFGATTRLVRQRDVYRQL